MNPDKDPAVNPTHIELIKNSPAIQSLLRDYAIEKLKARIAFAVIAIESLIIIALLLTR
jgi:hypothetical protein